MIIRKIPIDQINPTAYNPRKDLQPGDPEYEKLKRSMQEFGYVEPIVWNKRTGNVVGGHQRLKVLLDLGMQEVDCVVVDLDETKEKALNLALNKIQGDWDYLKLKDILQELDTGELDLELTGFDMGEIEDLVAQFHVPEEIIEDEVPEPPEEAITKLGDLWILGRHRLLCGDATKKEDVERLMDGKKADMVFTDPPYGYKYQSNMRTKTDKFDVLINDDKILDFMNPLKQVTDGFVFICTTWKALSKWLPLFNRYYDLTNMVIWYKGGGGIGDLKHTFITDYEIILCSNNGKEITGKRIGSVWDIQKDNANDYIHATQKPVELPARAIINTTNINNNVLDLFGGSGSTLIACEQLNRTCYMMEIDPKYCDVIVQRYINLKGHDGDVYLERDGNKIAFSNV